MRTLESFGMEQDEIKEKPKVFTVKELTRHISRLFERDEQLRDIWVKGEISNFKHHSSGHLYFDIKDEERVLKCVMFRRKSKKLKFTPTDGMEIFARGDVRVYEKRGIYQLYVEEIEVGGIGELYMAFKELEKKLKEEGLFDEKYKKPIPKIPEKIGIVTSPTGAAIKDILNVIKRRYPVDIILAPASVQGANASMEIERAIEMLNEIDGIDAMIVGRGGGSLEDLWAFNEERVARAIFASDIPVISAVGHETDFTIADFVADKRAPTPSAAAEIAVPNKKELREVLESFSMRIKRNVKNTIDFDRERLERIMKSVVFREPMQMVDERRQQIDDLMRNLLANEEHLLKLQEKGFFVIEGKLDALNPLAVLERGYSIAVKIPEETVLKKIGEMEIGKLFKLMVSNGEAVCEVEEKKEVKWT